MNSMKRRSWMGFAMTTAVVVLGCGGQSGTSFQSDGGYGANNMNSGQYGNSQSGSGMGNSVTLYAKEGQTLFFRDGEAQWVKLELTPSTTYDGLPWSGTAAVRDNKGRYSFAAIDEKQVQILDTTFKETPVASFSRLEKDAKVVQVPAKVTGYDPKEERLRAYTNVQLFNSDDKRFSALEGSDMVIEKEPSNPAIGAPTYPMKAKGLRLGPVKGSASVAVDFGSKEAFDYVPVSVKGYDSLRPVWENDKAVIEVLPSGAKDGGVTFLAPPAGMIKSDDHFNFVISKPYKTTKGNSGDTGIGWTAATPTNISVPKYPDDVLVDSAKVEKADAGQYRFNFTPRAGFDLFCFNSKEIQGAKPKSFTFQVTRARVNAKNGSNFAYVTPDLSKIPVDGKTDVKAQPADFDVTATGTGNPHPLEGLDLVMKNRANKVPIKDAPVIPGFDKGTWCVTSSTKVHAGN